MPDATQNISLIFLNGEPTFKHNGAFKSRLILCFGVWNINDLIFSEVDYYVELKENESGWYVDLSVRFSHETIFNGEKTHVFEVVGELNHAILNHQNFDFSKYIKQWQSMDENFDIKER